MEKMEEKKKIEQDLSLERRSYEKYHLDESTVTDNPMDLFQAWYNLADASDQIDEANAMTVSTIRPEGTPRARVVLLKRFTWEGFYFYTNYLSEKGRDIAACPSVCLSFFWDAFEREIIIEGEAEKAPTDVSDGYFATRPRGSRLGAWASEQSQVVPSRRVPRPPAGRLRETIRRQGRSPAAPLRAVPGAPPGDRILAGPSQPDARPPALHPPGGLFLETGTPGPLTPPRQKRKKKTTNK